jgi:hypothetical protein
VILVDTSVWIDHFRQPIEELSRLAAGVLILQHPYVTGELALGNFRNWGRVLTYLSDDLPQARVASEREFLAMVADSGLAGSGIGFVDTHLLASCRLAPGTLLWSRDRRLERFAREAGLAWLAA